MNNKVVARFVDGRTLKGFTSDFTPGRDRFHIVAAEAAAGSKPVEVKTNELKAIFFVKEFKGNPEHSESNAFSPARPPAGRKIRVVFKDGEALVGATQGYQSGRPGFFLIPADADSNIERCYVVAAATREVGFIEAAQA